MTGKANLSSTELALIAFHEIIVPLAQSAPHSQLDFYASPKEGSYFVDPSHSSLTRDGMKAMGERGELAELETLWRAQGHNHLLPLLPRLGEIAERIAAERGVDETTPDTPSQLIYQMY